MTKRVIVDGKGHSLDGASVGARRRFSECEGRVLPARYARQVLRSLFLIAEQQDALETNRLVRAERNADAQVMCSNDFDQARVLSVAEPEASMLGRHLECKGA